MRKFGMVAVFVTMSIVALAQSDSQNNATAPDQQVAWPKDEVTATCQSSNCVYDQNITATVSTNYDRFKDATTFILRPMVFQRLNTQSFSDLIMGAIFTCPGSVQRCTPNHVTLVFTAATSDWYFMKQERSLIFITESGKLVLPKADWDGETVDAYIPLREHMSSAISTADFLRVANATSVEGQLANTDFKLSARNLRGLQNLATFIIPPQKKGSDLRSTKRSGRQ